MFAIEAVLLYDKQYQSASSRRALIFAVCGTDRGRCPAMCEAGIHQIMMSANPVTEAMYCHPVLSIDATHVKPKP